MSRYMFEWWSYYLHQCFPKSALQTTSGPRTGLQTNILYFAEHLEASSVPRSENVLEPLINMDTGDNKSIKILRTYYFIIIYINYHKILDRRSL